MRRRRIRIIVGPVYLCHVADDVVEVSEIFADQLIAEGKAAAFDDEPPQSQEAAAFAGAGETTTLPGPRRPLRR